jgi:hypothetical protein
MAIQDGSTVVTLLRKDKLLWAAIPLTTNPLQETLADKGENQRTFSDFSF